LAWEKRKRTGGGEEKREEMIKESTRNLLLIDTQCQRDTNKAGEVVTGEGEFSTGNWWGHEGYELYTEKSFVSVT